MAKILIADDDSGIRQMLRTILETAGYEIDLAENGSSALEKAKNDIYDIILCDIKMPEMDGFQFLDSIREAGLERTIIMMTAYGSVETAVEAIRKGAFDYLSKPFKADEVIIAVKKAEERERLLKENTVLKWQFSQNTMKGLVFESPMMQVCVSMAEKIAPYRQPVLITGESGTGKEIIARLIHEKGPRAQAPFVAINCASIPENLLESELFGYAKGAFTDASKPKRGLLEYADNGTCFLDEISEMKEGLQSKLLRFLEDGEVRRVGDIKASKVNVRIISATNKDLKLLISEGKFREDLFYRLNVLPVHIGPLRERKEDIQAYVAREFKRADRTISNEVMQALLNYRWPGNFRELRNFIERTLILTDAKHLDMHTLPDHIFMEDRSGYQPEAQEEVSLKKAINEMEHDFIKRALAITGGNRVKAAKLLEISPRALHYKIKDYGLGD